MKYVKPVLAGLMVIGFFLPWYGASASASGIAGGMFNLEGSSFSDMSAGYELGWAYIFAALGIAALIVSFIPERKKYEFIPMALGALFLIYKMASLPTSSAESHGDFNFSASVGFYYGFYITLVASLALAGYMIFSVLDEFLPRKTEATPGNN